MTAMDTPPTPAPRAADEPVARVPKAVLAVAAIVIAGLLGYLLGWTSWTQRGWVRNATDKQARKHLVEESDPGIVDKIDAGMRDADLPRATRVALAGVLIEKNRLALVEKAAEDASLDLRTIALETLARQTFFRKQYADDPHFRFRDTELAWLKDASRSDRTTAIAVLPQFFAYGTTLPDDFLAALRALVTPATKDAALRYAAASSLAGYRDCASAAAVADLALVEEDLEAKLKLLQVVVTFYDSGGDECRKAVPEARVRAVVSRCLAHKGPDDGLNRAVRMGALGILTRHPEWAKAEAAVIRAVLDSNAHEVERRSALEAVVAAGDAASIARFPAYLHDPTGGVRASAAQLTQQDKPGGRLGLAQGVLNALLAGYLANETEGKSYEPTLRAVYATIRQRAGVWVGLPEPFRTKGGALSNDVAQMLHALFTTGSFEGTTRAQIADALFRWVAQDQKLTPAEVEAAAKAHGDFWTKARAGDVAGAKAVYDAVSPQKPDLWSYEKGWLLAKRAL